jgi:signal transduction histidine kinase/ActR/RegA family two-component response regulator
LLRSAFVAYEAFLRIDPHGKAGDRIRARAMVWFGWGFVLIQLLDIIVITLTDGRWTGDHTVALLVIVLLLSAVHTIRYYKNYAVYGLFMLVLTVTGVLASALPDHAGINSALIPILIMMPMLNGFISGPRVVLLTGAAMLATIGVLYYCTVGHGVSGAITDPARDLQRMLQSGYIVVMATVIATIFSANIFRGFSLLEASVGRAREAEAAKAQFLAAMSHELRTPLNGVLGLSEVMQKTSLDDEQATLMNDIEGSGRSLLSILNDIMDMLNIDAETIEIKPERFALHGLLSDAASTWRLPAEEKGLKLKFAVDDGAPQSLIGDELRIRQIITKIASNAVKYTKTGGVAISAKVIVYDDDSANLQVAIKDTGPGIPDGAAERIFNPFEQAEQGFSRSQDGVGLGLALCQRLARLMNGAVHYDSELGKGTTFYLTVPIEIAASVDAPAEAIIEDTPEALTGRRVLIVEDNIVNRMVAEKLLSSLGVVTQSAEHGGECLEIMQQHTFDAILMDKHMPVMDGVEATAKIRAMAAPVGAIPIVACTADAMGGEREALLGAGFDEFLAKPISADNLRNALEIVLHGKPTESQAA